MVMESRTCPIYNIIPTPILEPNTGIFLQIKLKIAESLFHQIKGAAWSCYQ
jgi:hypothetical protein